MCGGLLAFLEKDEALATPKGAEAGTYTLSPLLNTEVKTPSVTKNAPNVKASIPNKRFQGQKWV